MLKPLDREYILWRISDWKKRLNQLCSDITDWAGDVGEAEIRKSDIPQAREDLMHRFGIDPETVPAMAVRLGRHRAILLNQAGSLSDDETLSDLRLMIYSERGRPEEEYLDAYS